MSTQFSRIGALASLGCAGSFIFGFVVLLTQLMPYIELKENPAFAVQFVLENHTLLSLWNFVIYILFAVFLTVLVVALYQKLLPLNRVISQLAAVFGIVWITLVYGSGMVTSLGLTRVVEIAASHPSMAPSLWLAVITIAEGLGGSNELVGGLWVTLVSIVMWQARVYARVLSIIGLIAGTAGILSAAPALSDVGAVFGLSLIVWFIYLGVEMVRHSATKDD
ncbi:MAG: DUF4386 family protein [Granulosicoccus sp.]